MPVVNSLIQSFKRAAVDFWLSNRGEPLFLLERRKVVVIYLYLLFKVVVKGFVKCESDYANSKK